MTGIVLIGDGLLGALNPSRHARLWESGPENYRQIAQILAVYPKLVQVLSVLEAVLGYWLATAQEPNENVGMS